MTREEILVMKPGRELDVLVAANVFGKQHYRAPMLEWSGRYVYKDEWDNPDGWYDEWHRLQEIGEWEYCGPNYSTDISAAWEAVEKLAKRKQNIQIEHENPESWPEANGKWWFAYIQKNNRWPGVGAYGDTASEAICKAALLAVI